MRELRDHIVEGKNHNERVFVEDEPGPGGACHHYVMEWGCDPYDAPRQGIWFQRGPIAENGINGVSNEQVLTILKHRLEGLATGPFPSPETDEALEHVKGALEALLRRTRDRMAREVEGRDIA